MRGGWVYIMTNKRDGVLYVGVTAYLAARVHQHRTDRGAAFCRRYGLKTLVLVEQYDTIEEAITREKQIKAWRREWKVALIEAMNPDWSDLFDRIA
jgi:putative endonuclease